MDARPTALITGIAGQDGSYLAELLLRLGYIVHGLVRHSSDEYPARLQHLQGRLNLWPGDLFDQAALTDILFRVKPREIYHLAAQSVVSQSWNQPLLTADATAVGTLRLLEAIRLAAPEAKFYQSSSSEQFGAALNSPQNESTPFQPRNLYGVSKVFAHQATVNYRQHYDLFACCGILFNHESPRRGREFVTRRVSHGVAQIKLGLMEVLPLGSLSAQRDWGFAGDYVEAMWLMLQQDQPDDYVIGTGILHSVEDLVEAAFDQVGYNYQDWTETDPALLRPPEEVPLCADPSKAHAKLGWTPKVGFHDLVAMMVEADLAVGRRQRMTTMSLPGRRLKSA
ncbi:MAG TPA: GDP-mannose 4,6-dehydratase [Gemmatales bacterium]|nr:GDP-mannose 4,6-dehydratase [Gemmatales bacterium]